jgi:excisionase family DNA binding protein
MKSMNLLTVSELSQFLRVPPSWIYARTAEIVKEDDPLPYLKFGKLLRFDKEHVTAWVERHQHGSPSLVPLYKDAA